MGISHNEQIEKLAKEIGAKARANGQPMAVSQEYAYDHLAEATIQFYTRKS